MGPKSTSTWSLRRSKSLKGVFDFAIGAGKYSFDNSFANMHLVKKSERAKHTKSWLPYSKEEVQKLFVDEFDDYKTRFNKPDMFFVPIIGLTMELRLNEIAQLYASDVYQENLLTNFLEYQTLKSMDKVPCCFLGSLKRLPTATAKILRTTDQI